jgi:hypothetical protein
MAPEIAPVCALKVAQKIAPRTEAAAILARHLKLISPQFLAELIWMLSKRAFKCK